MKKLTNPNDFTHALLNSSKVCFESEQLRVEANRINEKNSRRAVQLRYFHRIGGLWKAFATFVSPSNTDCIDDVIGEFKVFGIVN